MSMFTWKREGAFLMGTMGIYVCYLAFGLFQEKVYKEEYIREDGVAEKFHFTMPLLLAQCIVNSLAAWIGAIVFRLEKNKTPPTQFAVVSATYIGAMLCSNAALNYVSYPTQVLAKSCKPIPVMLMGILVLKKVYPMSKYFLVLIISLGIATFMYNPDKAAKVSVDSDVDDSIFSAGTILLLTSLALDGVTAPLQEKLVRSYGPTPNHLMFFSNAWATLYLLVASLCTGDLFESVAFIGRHPAVIKDILVFSVTSAIGQNFIFFMLYTFGSLSISLVTTTRKFFTLLASIVYWGHAMSTRQWIGLSMVFSGLFIDVYMGYLSKSKVLASGSKVLAQPAAKKH
eukprot:TRINITY_DN10791_c0_g1_i2.p1 TRINITY_DN10791_c0_g1~~TRINITY_DN10791_c0_g1_i2.p1  ORF type:complete len:342 (-),score=77.97 TRINITY_DN10791_c0_g1_i2:51-1076(-)